MFGKAIFQTTERNKGKGVKKVQHRQKRKKQLTINFKLEGCVTDLLDIIYNYYIQNMIRTGYLKLNIKVKVCYFKI